MRKQWVVVGILAGTLFAGDALAQHKQPNEQPTTAAAPEVPTTEVALGTVRISRAVMADGKPLPAGTYSVRVTAQVAKPTAVGLTESLYRWAEFSQRGEVKGREVVTIVPDSEAKMVVQDTPPQPGGSKVQMLRGNEYLRVWFNRGGTHYLVHLTTGM
jgi:hypothetical protein